MDTPARTARKQNANASIHKLVDIVSGMYLHKPTILFENFLFLPIFAMSTATWHRFLYSQPFFSYFLGDPSCRRVSSPGRRLTRTISGILGAPGSANNASPPSQIVVGTQEKLLAHVLLTWKRSWMAWCPSFKQI